MDMDGHGFFSGLLATKLCGIMRDARRCRAASGINLKTSVPKFPISLADTTQPPARCENGPGWLFDTDSKKSRFGMRRFASKPSTVPKKKGLEHPKFSELPKDSQEDIVRTVKELIGEYLPIDLREKNL
jgi:hypothetical protein